MRFHAVEVRPAKRRDEGVGSSATIACFIECRMLYLCRRGSRQSSHSAPIPPVRAAGGRSDGPRSRVERNSLCSQKNTTQGASRDITHGAGLTIISVPCPADRLLRPEPLDFLMSIRKIYRTDNVRIRILVNKIENVKAHLWQAERGEQRIGVSRKPRNGTSKSFESSKENGHGWQ